MALFCMHLEDGTFHWKITFVSNLYTSRVLSTNFNRKKVTKNSNFQSKAPLELHYLMSIRVICQAALSDFAGECDAVSFRDLIL